MARTREFRKGLSCPGRKEESQSRVGDSLRQAIGTVPRSDDDDTQFVIRKRGDFRGKPVYGAAVPDDAMAVQVGEGEAQPKTARATRLDKLRRPHRLERLRREHNTAGPSSPREEHTEEPGEVVDRRVQVSGRTGSQQELGRRNFLPVEAPHHGLGEIFAERGVWLETGSLQPHGLEHRSPDRLRERLIAKLLDDRSHHGDRALEYLVCVPGGYTSSVELRLATVSERVGEVGSK